MAPPSADVAATVLKTVQAAAKELADPCHIHSKDFKDCLNSHEVRLGKCRNHLRLLYQCRHGRKAFAATEPSKVLPAWVVADMPAAPMRNCDSCHIPYEKLKQCLQDKEVRPGKCELHLHVLFECHMRAREPWS